MKKKNTRYFIVAAAFLIICIFAASGFFMWRSYVIKKQDADSFKTAQDLITASRPAEALAIIRTKDRSTTDAGCDRWLDLEIIALKQMHNIPRLLYIYEKSSQAFARNEDASLLIGRALLQLKKPDLFTKLREDWRSHETQVGAWFALDADALVLEGSRDKAIAFLNSHTFEGAEDCGRLTRLALLNAPDNLNSSWELLSKAYDLDPANSDVRSFRAQILDHINKKSLAQVEYVAAHLSDPGNPFLRDQLAEFYRRNEDYGLALSTWTGGLKEPSLDYIWLKTIFWNRVVQPVDFDWTTAPPPDGDLKPLVEYLLALPSGAFWDSNAFERRFKSEDLSTQRQEVFWLMILEALKKGKDDLALKQLQSNPFISQSWNPCLTNALKNVLTYRLWGILVPWTDKTGPKGSLPESEHQFFTQLRALSESFSQNAKDTVIPNDVDQLLKSKEAFSAIFLSAGWIEAALQLHCLPTIPDGFPDWLSYGLTQAFRYNRGNKEALAFAARQKPSAALDLLTAELLMADGQIDESLRRFSVLSTQDSDIGFRAAWLLSLAYLDREEIENANQTVQRHQRLLESVTGKEILAKIAIASGKTQEAEQLYNMVEKDSAEAKTYLARRAFAGKDWPAARRLTEELLRDYPGELQLRANLETIAEAEGKI